VFQEHEPAGRRQPTKDRSCDAVRIGDGAENPRCQNSVKRVLGEIRVAHLRLEFENPAHRLRRNAIAAFGKDMSLASGEKWMGHKAPT